jgi:hypothetical protein
MGAVLCADASNQALSAPGQSAAAFAQCRDYFNAAAAMKGKAALSPDSRLTSLSATSSILGDFESNFGLSGDEYLRRLLAGGGSEAALSEMVAPKVSADEVAKGYASDSSSASSATDEGRQANSGYYPAPSAALRAVGRFPASTMRSQLKAALSKPHDDEDLATMVSDRTALSGREISEHLEAAPVSFSSGASDAEDSGLTLFDVVHSRYRALASQNHLWSQKKPREP